MKKSVLIVLSVCLLMMTACSGVLPAGVSKEMYETAVYVLKVTDIYLDGEISAEQAYDRIDSIAMPEAENSDDNRHDSFIDSCILGLKLDFLSMEIGSSTATISELKSDRNKLANEINYKKKTTTE